MRSLPSEDLSDWELLMAFLPEGWEDLGRQSGALRRTRGFPDAESLLRTLLLYLVEGRSLKETALRVKQADLASVSSVAIWKRLKRSGEWFRLMNESMLVSWHRRESLDGLLPGRRLRLVDGTTVCEPGKTGSSWRIHYAVEFSTLRCDCVGIFDKLSGETFKRFDVEAGDVLVGDRVYANRPGIAYVLSRGGDVVVRLPYSNVPLTNKKGAPIKLLRHLRKLRTQQVGEWSWFIPPDTRGAKPVPVRVCAVKKSAAATELARKKMNRKAQKNGTYTPSPGALEAAGYFFVLTTLPKEVVPAEHVVELYRGRWQIELVFKRLKSILGLGHLPKQEPDGARAWLQGKLFVATLVETLIAAGDTFSPWGYPLRVAEEPMERDRLHV